MTASCCAPSRSYPRDAIPFPLWSRTRRRESAAAERAPTIIGRADPLRSIRLPDYPAAVVTLARINVTPVKGTALQHPASVDLSVART